MPFRQFAVCIFLAVVALPSLSQAQQRQNRDAGNDSVSFVNDVVPIINAKCGKCHVTSARGRYDIKSYDALMNSDSIDLKFPDDSYFIEVIENGDMPKGGLKVSSKELETLKQWIVEGAKFDGDDETNMISNRGGGNAQRSSRGRSNRTQGRSSGRGSSRSRRGRSNSSAFDSNALLGFLDTNGDGKLSLTEIDAAKRLLYSLDTNEDDRLTADEVKDLGGR